jgi:hypothetical protein
MNKLTQHIPNFAYNGQEIKSWDFNSVEELLNLEYVKSFSEEGHSIMISGKNILMTVKDDNSWWWVIGRLEEPVDLPVWRGANDK